MQRKKKGALARRRRQAELAKQAESRKAVKEYERTFSSSLFGTKVDAKEFVEYKPKSNPYIEQRRADFHSIPSLVDSKPSEPKVAPKYEGEMLEREIAAQQEIERKKKRTAPAYSKGAYQYITDETDIKEIGRKL
jgi:hypothetical protein